MTENNLSKNSAHLASLIEQLFPNIKDELNKQKIIAKLKDLLDGGLLTKEIVERYTGQAVLELPAYQFVPYISEAFLGNQIFLNPTDVSPNVYLENGAPPSFHLIGGPAELKKYYQEFVEKQQRSPNGFRDVINHSGGIWGISFGLGGNGITGAPLLGMAIPGCSFLAFQIIPGTNPNILFINESDFTKSQRLANFLVRNTLLTLPETSRLGVQRNIVLENNSLIINNIV